MPPDKSGGSTTYSYPQPSWVMGVVPIGPAGPDPARGVLTFTTQPLENDMEIAGTAKLILYAASTRNDTDFIVKISEQFGQNARRNARGAFSLAPSLLQRDGCARPTWSAICGTAPTKFPTTRTNG